VRDYVLTLLVTAAVTYLLTPLVRRLAALIGAMKAPRDRDVHVAPVPLIGGLGMYGGLCAGLLVASRIPQLRGAAFTNTGMVSGLLLAGGLLVVIGIVDDRWGMSALTKGAGQVAAAGILVATGTSFSFLPEPGGGTFVPTTVQSTVLTIVVVVATINAVNFIDGLDGLAAGIVCIAAISFFAYYYSLTRVIHVSALASPALASAILIGMCLGFLPHNFSPASIFMGDTGAMLLGLLLAYAPIASINSLDPSVLDSQINRYPEIMPLLLPAALLVIPYADLLLAVVRRTRAGMSPFAPDRKHLHHRLLDIGHSQRASVLIMYLWAAVFSGVVVLLSIEKTEHAGASNHHGVPVFVLVAVTVAAVAALLLMSMPRLRWWQRKSRPAGGQVQARPAAGLPGPAAGTAVAGPAVAGPGAAGAVMPAPAAGSGLLAAAVAPASGTWPELDAVPPDVIRPDPARQPEAGRPGAQADVTMPDISRSWQARPGGVMADQVLASPANQDWKNGDRTDGGEAGSGPAVSGRPAAGQQDQEAGRPGEAVRSVVGTVPPSVTDLGRAPRRTAAAPVADAWPEDDGRSRWQQPEPRPAAARSPARGGAHRAGPPADEPARPGADGS
jgi:UDP-GlcNAc:undecaprenyl-phosphate GlcNAc-1-phosphate transferase